jgi:hypothetical protein
MKNYTAIALKLVIAVLTMVGLTLAVQVTWIITMAGVLGLPVLNFWQSLSLLILCSILFKKQRIKNE